MNRETIAALERQGWDALCASRGGEFYGALMADDGLMVLVNGMALDREAVIASLNQAPAWDSYVIRDERMIPLGPDAAVLVYRAIATRGSDTFEALMSSTYVRDGGSAKLKFYQQTTATH